MRALRLIQPVIPTIASSMNSYDRTHSKIAELSAIAFGGLLVHLKAEARLRRQDPVTKLPTQQGLKFLSDLARIWPAAWRTLWRTNKKARTEKALAWAFSGAGDGNRTRVRSLEGFSSTIEPHPRLVGTTGFEPATSCSQSRRATRLRHVPTSKQPS